jgi:hypothetical protein
VKPKTKSVLAALLGSLALFAQMQALAQQAAPLGETGAREDSLLRLMLDKGLVPVDAAAHGLQVARQVRDKASDLVIASMNFLGVAYRRGGSAAEEGFDCSGFVRYMFQHTAGLVLPRRADEQAHSSAVFPIARDELRPGDLVFFNTLRQAFSHVGIYIGDGKFIHSPRTGSSIRIEDMGKDYWVTRFNGARRVAAIQTGAADPAAERTSLR